MPNPLPATTPAAAAAVMTEDKKDIVTVLGGYLNFGYLWDSHSDYAIKFVDDHGVLTQGWRARDVPELVCKNGNRKLPTDKAHQVYHELANTGTTLDKVSVFTLTEEPHVVQKLPDFRKAFAVSPIKKACAKTP